MLHDDDFFFSAEAPTAKASKRATRFAVIALAACIAMLSIVVAQVNAMESSYFEQHDGFKDSGQHSSVHSGGTDNYSTFRASLIPKSHAAYTRSSPT